MNENEESGSVETNGDTSLSGIDASILRSLGISPESTHGTNEGKASEGTPVDGSEDVLEAGEPQDGVSEPESTQSGAEDLFEIIHDGTPVKMTREELLAHAQKGFDYTKKTMTLSEERKAIEAEKAKLMEEFQKRSQGVEDVLSLKEQWDFYLDSLAQQNPDLFEEIKEGFSRTSQQFKNPVVEAQLKAFNQKMGKIEEVQKAWELEQIRKGFEKEFEAEVSGDWGKLLTSAGLTPDKEKITKAWIDHGGSVRDALKLVYSDDVVKLMQSKSKLNEVKKKVAAKPASVSSVKKSAPEVKDEFSPRKMSWNDIGHLVNKKYLK